MCLSDQSALRDASLGSKPFEICANPHAHNQNINRANLCENMSRFQNCSGASPNSIGVVPPCVTKACAVHPFCMGRSGAAGGSRSKNFLGSWTRLGAVTPQPSTRKPVRNTPSTAGNSMTSSERPSPEPILTKETSPAVLGGREFWKRSGRLKCLEL